MTAVRLAHDNPELIRVERPSTLTNMGVEGRQGIVVDNLPRSQVRTNAARGPPGTYKRGVNRPLLVRISFG